MKVHVNSDDYRRGCFVRESKILEELRGQPDVLPLVEVRNQFEVKVSSDATGDTPIPFQFDYFTTELAERDVKDLIYGSEPSATTLLETFRGICRGVQRVHEKGICHRDVKPGNCFLGPRGETWLGDFGTARRVDGTEPPLLDDYQEMTWRGDARYAAPEMVCGLEHPEAFLVGDSYSLGAILFEMFTRSTLFSFVFDLSFTHDLGRHFAYIPVDKRQDVFEQFLPSILSDRSLPTLRQLPNRVPQVISGRLNRLYQSLAALDYRRRLTDFSVIFQELNACTLILRRETQYKAWREQRRRRLGGDSEESI
jgi:serine/threonine protein kinase